MSLLRVLEDWTDGDWYYEHVWCRWHGCVRFYRRLFPSPPPTPEQVAAAKRFADQLSPLVKALEAGDYNPAPSELKQGSELRVESLCPIVQCVTFCEPAYFRKMQRRMERLAKTARFFRMHGWAETSRLAAIYFKKEADRLEIH